MARNYAKEAKYDSQPAVMAKRAMRNRARRLAIKEGIAKVGDGKDIDHKKEIYAGGTNALSNLQAVPASKNRSYPRDKSARRKK